MNTKRIKLYLVRKKKQLPWNSSEDMDVELVLLNNRKELSNLTFLDSPRPPLPLLVVKI